MDKSTITYKIYEIILLCDVHSFPIDCIDIIKKCGIKLNPYTNLSEKKQQKCFLISDEAFTLKGEIYYNDRILLERMRFSLMHELGHIILEHSEKRTNTEEQEANFFASNILAPRIVIHYSNCKNAADVMKRFKLSEEASNYTFEDYRKWRRNSIHKSSKVDELMYQHFYIEDANTFVWDVNHCEYCYINSAYNGDTYCRKCMIDNLKIANTISYDAQEKQLDFLRSNWLYG